MSTLAHRPIVALRDARRAVRLYADIPAAHRVLAFILRELGRSDEAEMSEATGITVSEQALLVVAARSAWKAGRAEEAEQRIRAHLRSDPEDASANTFLGDIALRCGQSQAAETLYRRAIGLAPGYLAAKLALVRLLTPVRREAEAIALLDEILERLPTDAEAIFLKAGLLSQAKRHGAALKAFEDGLRLHPNHYWGWVNYGFLLKTIGRVDESTSAYRHALSINHTNGAAWWGLANLKTASFTCGDIETMLHALETPDRTDDGSVQTQFALAQALGQHSRHAEAMRHLDLGNAMRRRRLPWNADALTERVDAFCRIYDRCDDQPTYEKLAATPIFIVGLPRSGSTLIEQILASHSLVEGTEELWEIERIALQLGDGASAEQYFSDLQNIDNATLRRARNQYIERSVTYRKNKKPYFTDKMPSNWRHIALINRILPEAKIVDVRRHPLACGFANYSQLYDNGVEFSYSLSDIGRFYVDYAQYVAHFATIAPAGVHHVIYEDVVDNLEVAVRSLLDFIGIPFEAACLEFYSNRRAVHTPSAQQVRRPINRTGLDRWQAYDEWLGPLKTALGSILDTYPAIVKRNVDRQGR